MDTMMDALDYDPVIKATRKVGWGMNTWNTDEDCTTHAASRGRTACGVEVGPFARGWLVGTWSNEPVTCKRCLRVLAKGRK